MITTLENSQAMDEFLWGLGLAVTCQKRTRRQFAEEEITIPNGPFAGEMFDCDRQPYAGLYYDALDSGLWNRAFATGPTQSGKTLCCFVIIILYHLFELEESVIAGLPDMNMSRKKWTKDIKPVIDATRYARYLPKEGRGSKGGQIDELTFGNGTTLGFISAGGGDKTRAGDTARVLVMTEIDGYDESSEASRESDKVTQMEARTDAFDDDRMIYGECTLSTKSGRTYCEISGGTDSRILLECPHCLARVGPEREHFLDWEDAPDELSACKAAAFYCPACGIQWSEADRVQANQRGVIVHKGQEIGNDGCTIGEMPKTKTLGFRWSAVNNMFVSTGGIASKLYKAERKEDQEDAEKSICQFLFAVPYVPDEVELIPLSAKAVQRRTGVLYQSVVPADAEALTVGIDVHKKSNFWVAVAWTPRGPYVVDYGVIENPWNLGDEIGITRGLEDFKEHILAGWSWDGHTANKVPDLVGIDSGWATETIHKFTRAAGAGFWSTKGFGVTVFSKTIKQYTEPKNKTTEIRKVGLRWHTVKDKKTRNVALHYDVDFWKSWVHTRLSMDRDEEGALVLFKSHGDRAGKKGGAHHTFSHHLCAEVQRLEFTPLHGEKLRWHRVSRNNHYLDATGTACMLGNVFTKIKGAKMGGGGWFKNQKGRK
jgi:phage terminase large subunit GpA-like protein